jgi:hypothetical protein
MASCDTIEQCPVCQRNEVIVWRACPLHEGQNFRPMCLCCDSCRGVCDHKAASIFDAINRTGGKNDEAIRGSDSSGR